jgi:hypothetical protein
MQSEASETRGARRFFNSRPDAASSTQRSVREIFGTGLREETTHFFWARPDGWVGHWSKRYGQVLARTFGARPPLDASAQELVAYVPHPFSEALDPLASAAEPVDRDGRVLTWRWERSVTRDLLGVSGVALGIAGLLVIAALTLLRLAGPPPTATPSVPGQQQQTTKPQDKIPLPNKGNSPTGSFRDVPAPGGGVLRCYQDPETRNYDRCNKL